MSLVANLVETFFQAVKTIILGYFAF